MQAVITTASLFFTALGLATGFHGKRNFFVVAVASQEILYGKQGILNVTYTNLFIDLNMTVVLTKKDVIKVSAESISLGQTGQIAGLYNNSNETISATLKLYRRSFDLSFTATEIGRTLLKLRFTTVNGSKVHPFVSPSDCNITVVRERTLVQDILFWIQKALLALLTFLMGCIVQWDCVKELLRRPIDIGIGVFCQCVYMPVFAFAFMNVFLLPLDWSQGLLLYGLSPGGVLVNVASLLQDTIVELSVILIIINTLLTFGTLPLLVFIFKDYLGGDITYANLSFTFLLLPLVLVTIPLVLGGLLQHGRPAVRQRVLKALNPISLTVCVIIIGFQVYDNLYIFRFLSWKLFGCAVLMLVSGALAGGLTGWVCQRKFLQVKTVAIATAMQNGALAKALLGGSLPQPDADLAAVIPAFASLITLVIMLVAYVVHVLLIKYRPYYLLHDLNRARASAYKLSTDGSEVQEMLGSGDIILQEQPLERNNSKQTNKIPIDNEGKRLEKIVNIKAEKINNTEIEVDKIQNCLRTGSEKSKNGDGKSVNFIEDRHESFSKRQNTEEAHKRPPGKGDPDEGYTPEVTAKDCETNHERGMVDKEQLPTIEIIVRDTDLSISNLPDILASQEKGSFNLDNDVNTTHGVNFPLGFNNEPTEKSNLNQESDSETQSSTSMGCTVLKEPILTDDQTVGMGCGDIQSETNRHNEDKDITTNSPVHQRTQSVELQRLECTVSLGGAEPECNTYL
ncbi:uncharacterized protein LOC106155592 [Lingula anatina]|uniref:Uncharacterized protein LOC106155592 n=1 Tax=Lingula anatina TaxID=7574 RepID=A0A1S3HKF0_LINAN|nr:uncharacterized protein LOC106155592 [Lingula anatina]|eukprot:XP_013385941.1 uncharacterized protein LOC106155592 [Lingula anatina]